MKAGMQSLLIFLVCLISSVNGIKKIAAPHAEKVFVVVACMLVVVVVVVVVNLANEWSFLCAQTNNHFVEHA